ncbi:MAG: hypothetical protein R2883_04710 [Caldisericia bacterium]
MHIAVLIKQVPDTQKQIDPEKTRLFEQELESIVNPFDMNAACNGSGVG